MSALSETEFQSQIVQLARITGWRVNHTRRSRGKGGKWATTTSCIGFPDLTLWNPRHHRVLFVELKTDTGKLTDEQTAVLQSLQDAGADVRVWRPADWNVVQQILTHPERREAQPA